jgi:hypothetical protein
VPSYWTGAAIATGRTATGLRTTWFPPFQVIAPNAYSSYGAETRLIVTVNVTFCFGATVMRDGVTVMSTPAGSSITTSYVRGVDATEVTVRVRVCDPASAPIARDGVLRSLGSIGPPASSHSEPVSSRVPHR